MIHVNCRSFTFIRDTHSKHENVFKLDLQYGTYVVEIFAKEHEVEHKQVDFNQTFHSQAALVHYRPVPKISLLENVMLRLQRFLADDDAMRWS